MDTTQTDTTIEYGRMYSSLSVDELLNLALDEKSLTPAAKSALRVELAKRKLGSTDISKQGEGFQRRQIKDERRKPLVWNFRGFGTEMYGKRDLRLMDPT